MKRLVSLLLAVSMMISLAACGNQKADKYCTNCGSGMAKSDSFCPECGTAVGGAVTSSSVNGADEMTTATTTTTEEVTTTTTNQGKPSTEKPTTTSKPTTTIAPTTTITAKPTTTTKVTTTKEPSTTTKKPTTTTTTAHKHTYSKYICTGCGEIDKAHAYEYLVEWTLQNGKTDGTQVSYLYQNNNVKYGLSYNAQSDVLYVFTAEYKNGSFVYCSLSLDYYSYYSAIDDDTVLFGYLTPSQFTNSYPLSYKTYTGDNSIKYDFIEFSRLSVNRLLEWLDWMLDRNSVGVTLSDLGFTSYVI